MKPSIATTPPIALTIAGSDSSGGAGIQADIKTFTALGVYGASAITALTAQNTRGVAAVHAVPPAFITAQLDAVCDDLAIAATKTGMLGDSATVAAVADGVVRWRLSPLVVDPVMVATSGAALLAPDAVEAVAKRLFPLAALVTPNLHEAATLLSKGPAGCIAEMEMQALALLDFGPQAVLLKGGHFENGDAIDVLALADRKLHHFTAPRIATSNTHGTGCTLAAAVAAFLALGLPLAVAVERAKAFVTLAIRSGRDMHIGKGGGPVDHMHAILSETD
ncbi:MAG: bifunctional hydroxymethylpyrimidine kinase/phosphomethylpyrimidine kinase [Hyphomicrobiaceae bacterium]|nr:bifunctional hydroxymethylpyrimidine kinase/phosphomethylpyrimidine kinase [Hyphomicrobiaceae bacterium]